MEWTAKPSPCPRLPYQVEIRGTQKEALSTLSKKHFINTLCFARQVALKLQDALQVHRIGLLTTMQETIQLYPLHGISEEWTPILAPVIPYAQEDPGFITTQSGPQQSSTVLTQLQNEVHLHHAPAGEPSYQLVGETGDPQNLFVRLIRGEIEQWRVWESSTHVACLTPFPSIRGTTVVLPKQHLTSNLFALSEEDYTTLLSAVYDVMQVLAKTWGCAHVGLAFEGFEIDYAHAKLYPIPPSKDNPIVQEGILHKTYPGYLSSHPGPRLSTEKYQDALSTLSTILESPVEGESSIHDSHLK